MKHFSPEVRDFTAFRMNGRFSIVTEDGQFL